MEKFILNAFVFLFPFFFLTLTQEYYVTNKLYLLAFAVLFLLLLSTIKLLISKKISWQKRPFDNLILLFLTAVSVSVIFSSPNKIQALLNPSFGLVMMISLAILYFYLSRINDLGSRIYHLGSFILSLLTIAFFFQPFKNISLPQNFAFLKSSAFTPLGSQLDLAVFLGFFVVYQLSRLLTKKQLILNSSLLILNLLALFLTVYKLIPAIRQPADQLQLILPPFSNSWYAALEVLKNPQTALIGAGIDNFSAVFTRVKDLAYNQSTLWSFNTFNLSRSAVLQILTETGILGLATFGLLIFNVMKSAFVKTTADKQFIFSFLYLLICLFIFPTSLIVWFLFFISIAELSRIYNLGSNINKKIVDLSDLQPIYIGIVIISFGFIIASGYFLGRSYASEYYFKKSLDGVVKNNLKEIYENQRQAIILNPYMEKFRSNFAQINLVIANNLLQKGEKEITEQDKQTVIQAIQAGIAEAKAVISLNPQKAANWELLASIYRNIINVTKDADAWTVSAYQRAIVLDPQNPIYRISLGGVYYSSAKYEEASRLFEQAVSLKPDWPNAYYNYAWANFQKEDYPQAVNAMENALNLINPKLNKEDYEKAKKDLEEFKKKLPEEKEPAKTGETKPGTLNLPSPPATQISPKINLPKEASPEAR
ncbi:MAG: hypothetical protein V1803_03060 [Candidatus Roizmanbacteria bacterium]